MSRYRHKPFPYTTPPELSGGKPFEAPVVIVGAGPIGLSAAIDLAQHGVASVVLDENNVVTVGSRAICWAKRTLEIFDRLGVGERMREKGVTWQAGRLFHRDREVYHFDLMTEPGHRNPAFINLQQYYVEAYLIDRCADFAGLIDLRWNNRVTGVEQSRDSVRVRVETPDGGYDIEADYLLACDGARSTVRSSVGLDFAGEIFWDRFLIADVEMEADFPSERWFWFEPTFHSGQSALLHKQPDNIYRIDLQLGWDADPGEEKKPENVVPRIQAMFGDRDFKLEWVSLYTFQCRRLERFVHDHVIFLGDSAHLVSPFGARGGNGGIQDVDNLCWKLAAVIDGRAPAALLDSYDEERCHAADENILNSTRATRFMTPDDDAERLFRDAVLALAEDMPFARQLINSGRPSKPCSLAGMALQSDDDEGFDTPVVPGTACPDAVVAEGSRPGWLLDHLGGAFKLLSFGDDPARHDGLGTVCINDLPVDGCTTLRDVDGLVAERYGADPGAAYLIRPDQHVAARFRNPTPQAIGKALARASGKAMEQRS